MSDERRLEIGCGPSPKPSYESNDVNPGFGVQHIGAAQDLNFPDETFVEIFGTGAIEHLTYEQAAKFLRKSIRWLKPGGFLYLDAPDMVGWFHDMLRQNRTKSSVMTALNGWCRWPGDEHKSYWTLELMKMALETVGYGRIDIERASDRNGGPSKGDWHVVVRAYRPEGALPTVIAPTAQSDGWEAD